MAATGAAAIALPPGREGARPAAGADRDLVGTARALVGVLVFWFLLNGSAAPERGVRCGMAKKSWADMTPRRRTRRRAGVVEVALTTWCLRDLKQRPGAGARAQGAVGTGAVGPAVGPIAYLVWGRKR